MAIDLINIDNLVLVNDFEKGDGVAVEARRLLYMGAMGRLIIHKNLGAFDPLAKFGGVAGLTQAILLAGNQQCGDGYFFIGRGVGIAELTGNFFDGWTFETHRRRTFPGAGNRR